MTHKFSTSKEERARLSYVVAEIDRQHAEVEKQAGGHLKDLTKGRREMWQDVPKHVYSFDDAVVMSQHAQLLSEQEHNAARYQQMARRLEQLRNAPYFGRIDFKEHGNGVVDSLYIGITSLVDGDGQQHLVYDWRAPISSMFYDSEPGEASYDCDAGTISGELLLKRQYKIEDGELLYFFDTNVKIDDDILQQLLAKQTDDKMRHIVTSIQREQNRIIRDEKRRVLVVQGPAGSGKTSIALHRAAYLLYRYRDSLKAENIVIFSPNDVFSDYIGHVLPDLGEDPVGQLTFTEYAQQQLGSRLQLQPMHEQLEYLLSQRHVRGYSERVANIRYKASAAFFTVVQRYIAYLESGAALPLRDIYFQGRCVMTAEEIRERLQHQYADWPYSKRLESLQRRIEFVLEEPMKTAVDELAEELATDPDVVGLSAKEIKRRSRRLVNAELKESLAELEGWTKVDAFRLYRQLFSDKTLFGKLSEGTDVPEQMRAIRRQTVAAFNEGRLNFEDIAPLMYLRLALEGGAPNNDIRHVIVDEAQDYSVFHYEVLRGMFPQSSFTILGDMQQSVHPYMNDGTYDGVVQAMAPYNPLVVQLERSYRSTQQIARFTKALLPDMPPVEQVERDGDLPRVMTVTPAGHTGAIVAEVKRMQGQGIRSIAVLCKTAAESCTVHEAIKPQTKAVLLEWDDTTFRTGVVVLPVYLAKGLEFDGVIVTDAGEAAYGHEEERKALYTACTRALHQLTVMHIGALSPFVKEVPEAYYTATEGVTR